MRILLLVNPIAGRGRAALLADGLEDRLLREGHAVRRAPTSPDGAPPPIDDAELLVVAGGDGAVRAAAGPAAAAGVPIHQYPCGTENLFAREWGMAPLPSRVLEAIRRDRHVRADLAVANGEDCVLMASMGLDANVVHDLGGRRRGSISHLSYAAPIARQWWRWQAPTLEVTVDGRSLGAARGLVVIANSRQYGGRLDPARDADMTDGRLDAVLVSAPTRGAAAARLLAARRGRLVDDDAVRVDRGCVVEVTADRPCLIQIDGDMPQDPRPRTELRVEVRPGALTVLAGAHRATAR